MIQKIRETKEKKGGGEDNKKKKKKRKCVSQTCHATFKMTCICDEAIVFLTS